MADAGRRAGQVEGGGRRGLFDRWLKPQQMQQPTGQLAYEVLAGSGDLSDTELVDGLAREVVRNYVIPRELEMVFEDLCAPEVAAYLRVNKFPSVTRTRHGDFGEIVTGALYRLVRRWCVPILKLRYKQTANQAVQGTDVLAFRFRRQPPVIAVPEVKTRATRKKALGEEAYDSLEKVLGRLDESLAFAMNRCAERGQGFLARRLAALIRNPANRVVERHMLFVHDTDAWKDDVVELLVDKVTQPTELTVVKIDDLQAFVAGVYTAAEDVPSQQTRTTGEPA
ncbi:MULTISPECIES: hypothetical protein [unclassified Streptomyces]|uniref:hypothetical protein n=1 Tax=unclassified Streptomyces TaxID=2593676 RepID=UPI003330F8E9